MKAIFETLGKSEIQKKKERRNMQTGRDRMCVCIYNHCSKVNPDFLCRKSLSSETPKPLLVRVVTRLGTSFSGNTYGAIT